MMSVPQRATADEYLRKSDLRGIMEEAASACFVAQAAQPGLFLARHFASKFASPLIEAVQLQEAYLGCHQTVRVTVTLVDGTVGAATASFGTIAHPSSSRRVAQYHPPILARSAPPAAAAPATGPGAPAANAALAAAAAALAASTSAASPSISLVGDGLRLKAAALSTALQGQNATLLANCDRLIRQADGTDNLSTLGAPIVAAVSIACAEAAAAFARSSALKHMLPAMSAARQQLSAPAGVTAVRGASAQQTVVASPTTITRRLPIPIVTLFGVEARAFGRVRCREVLVFPAASTPMAVAAKQLTRMCEEAVLRLSPDDTMAPPTNPDGSLKAVAFESLAQMVDTAEEIIREAGLVPGTDVFVGLNLDAALCCKHAAGDGTTAALGGPPPTPGGPAAARYTVVEGAECSGAQLAETLAALVKDKKGSLAYLEDPLGERDTGDWRRLMSRVGGHCAVSTAHGAAGNLAVAQSFASERCANLLTVRLNDVGTIAAAAQLVHTFTTQYPGSAVAVACESIEGNASFMADFATAVDARFLRLGGLHRAERSAALRRLVDIEAELTGAGVFDRRPHAAFPPGGLELPPPPAEPVEVVNVKDPKKKK